MKKIKAFVDSKFAVYVDRMHPDDLRSDDCEYLMAREMYPSLCADVRWECSNAQIFEMAEERCNDIGKTPIETYETLKDPQKQFAICLDGVEEALNKAVTHWMKYDRKKYLKDLAKSELYGV